MPLYVYSECMYTHACVRARVHAGVCVCVCVFIWLFDVPGISHLFKDTAVSFVVTVQVLCRFS